MKKFRQNAALALACIAAAPFLFIGFIIWLFAPDENPCCGCPTAKNIYGKDPQVAEDAREYCKTCKVNPENRKKKKNRKCP